MEDGWRLDGGCMEAGWRLDGGWMEGVDDVPPPWLRCITWCQEGCTIPDCGTTTTKRPEPTELRMRDRDPPPTPPHTPTILRRCVRKHRTPVRCPVRHTIR
ncbi:hypothetical protein EYF80_038451 [Liparis tanakae]|uniref:Uncharacterized protein n=1 Tax=Liparis tanakae TaxID=230148 RepID=A0A4Z2GEN5_9TELE|nr:hypothetical protein EYF80_038451 [Liparis tanakae]